MAFSTELVLAAQTGPSAELVTGSRTTGGNTGTWSSSLDLPPGLWFVVVRGRYGSFTTSSTSEQRLRIDGQTRFTWTPNGGTLAYPTASLDGVVGGRSITIEYTAGTTNSIQQVFGGSRGWDFYAARVG